MPPPPEQPAPPIKMQKLGSHNCKKIIKTGDEFDSKAQCMYEIGEKAISEGFKY